MNTILNGIDRISEWKKLLKGKRIGVMTHAPAVSLNYERSADILYRNLDVRLFWGPEHGLDGVAQAGDAVGSSRDSHTGLPVYSLYKSGDTSFADTLHQADAVICDFSDIGSRFYTYISSMADAMKVCADQHVPFYVLDRPNPVNGIRCDGTLLEKEQESFVGRFPIPVRHGMTIGETARVFNEKFEIGCDLTVIPVRGWKRSMEFEDSGRVWINPSPNMPSADCARIYTGTCLLEGTNVSEGRGTTRPYEMIGAPFIDPVKLADALNSFHIPGVRAVPCRFRPTFSKFKDEACGGVQFVITDRKKADCFEAGIRLIDILRNEYSNSFEYIRQGPFFDHLAGTSRFRTGKVTADEFIEEGRTESSAFRNEISDLLLYKA